MYDADKNDTLVFLTNHLAFGATPIAAIYKNPWQVELFKALKQNVKIKTFVGISANALKGQVWTALIAMLLLRYLQLCSHFAAVLALRLVAIEPGDAAADEPVHASRSLGLAGGTVYGAPPLDAPEQEALALA